jgi:hypothetical protein
LAKILAILQLNGKISNHKPREPKNKFQSRITKLKEEVTNPRLKTIFNAQISGWLPLPDFGDYFPAPGTLELLVPLI